MTLVGTAWTGTAPSPGNPTVSGTITSTTDFSDHIRQITWNSTRAMQDFTTFGDGSFISQKPGLIGADITIDPNQDFAASSIDAVFGAAFLAGTLYYIDLKPTNSARGSTNPSWVAACYVSAYTPLGDAVGSRAAAPVGLSVTGTFARLTS
jgi:hypothetical protein